MHSTPKANRLHIAFFGRRNVGKSSLMNAFCNQEIAIVSPVAGTTTDAVEKAIEIPPLGPVNLIDTAGIDDQGQLGSLRVQKSLQVLSRTDFALLVISAQHPWAEAEEKMINLFNQHNINFIIVWNKKDLSPMPQKLKEKLKNYPFLEVSAHFFENIDLLKNIIVQKTTHLFEEKTLLQGLIKPQDTIVLVTPIDKSAPKNRLILPQVQTIREILDQKAQAFITNLENLPHTLNQLKNLPHLVITDSQVFKEVEKKVPNNIFLTSFSILFSYYKGELLPLIQGIKKIKSLKKEDTILIAEACSHHAQADDIGRVKIPLWLSQHLGFKPTFDFSSGKNFPNNLSSYALAIQCGGCMINKKEMEFRIKTAQKAQVPMVNYGMLIAYLNGILNRSLEIFNFHETQIKA